VRHLSSQLAFVSFSGRNETMGQDMLPRGEVMQEDGSYVHLQAGAYIVHTDDAIRVHLTDDRRRLNGCCGLDGCDGPNLRCDCCNAYVATRFTDCWRPHCVLFDPTATRADRS
jgi:hypothetical protein